MCSGKPRSHTSYVSISVFNACSSTTDVMTGLPREYCHRYYKPRLVSNVGADCSLSVVLGSGGQVAMVWGLVVSAIGTLFMVISLYVSDAKPN